ncbi:MAG TPA: site-specific integrase [Candidatus Binataceae bacterium]|nr:site-specific integrase [Candidatus Binataceae bacterium]
MLYKRGGTWWYEFVFNGSRIRESAKTTSRTIARQAELKRRRDLALSVNGLVKREPPPLFPIAAKQWLDSKTALTPLGQAYYGQYVGKLKRHFGNRLISDITADDIADLQRTRMAERLSGRQVNCEVATLRCVLRHFGLWAGISHRVKMLKERTDTGRALSIGDERRLLDAIAQSPSAALYPFFILSLDAGLRPAETRALRRRDLNLVWRDGVIEAGEIIVSDSKTDAGSGRCIPLTQRACGALSLWLSRFPDAGPDAFVFPFHHVGLAGNGRKPHLWGIDLNRPMSTYSYKTAFNTARATAKVDCRFYDARHSFITRLAENPTISEETIRQLAGHVSPRMLARYAHIRAQARRAAIATLEPRAGAERAKIEGDYPQNPPQSADGAKPVLN